MQRTDSLCSTRSDESSSAICVSHSGFGTGKPLQAVIVSIPAEQIGESTSPFGSASGSLSAGAVPFTVSELLASATPSASVASTTTTSTIVEAPGPIWPVPSESTSTKPNPETDPDTVPKPAVEAPPAAAGLAPKVTYACNLRRSQSANVPSAPVMRLKARARPMKQSPLLGRGASGEEADATTPTAASVAASEAHKSCAKVTRGKSDRKSPAAAGRGRVIELVRGPRGFGFTMRAIRVYTSEESDSYTLQHMVTAVEEGSGAARSGVVPGELLVEVNGVRTEGLLHTDVLRLIVQGGNTLRVRVLNMNESSIRSHRSRKKCAVHIRMVKPSAVASKLRHRSGGGSDHSNIATACSSKEDRKRSGGRTHHATSSGSSLLRRLSAKHVAEKCRLGLVEKTTTDADVSSTSASSGLPLSLPPDAAVLRLRIPDTNLSASTSKSPSSCVAQCSRGSSSCSGRSSSGRAGSSSSTESSASSPPLRASTAPTNTATRPFSLYSAHQKQSPEHRAAPVGTTSSSTSTARLGLGLVSMQRAPQQPLSPLVRPHDESTTALSAFKLPAAAADRDTERDKAGAKRGSWKETDL